MQKNIIGVGVFFLLILGVAQVKAETPFKRNKRGPSNSVFPSYPNRESSTVRGSKSDVPVHALVPQRQDVNGNRVTDDHLNRVHFADQRAHSVMKNDPHVVNHVSFQSAAFTSQLRPVYEQRNVVIHDHFQHYNSFVVEHPLVWDAWHRHHFYGGFYYGFHPVPDIQIYFSNPLVHWFYVGTWDDQYYHTWYAGEYSAYPQLNHAFKYYGIFYPTDNLRQLLFGVSAMPVDKQANFRDEISVFTENLTQQLANELRTHVVLSKGDMVVTHYENVGNDNAIVMEGFVNFQNHSHNFKNLLNLDDTDKASQRRVQVFVASSAANPPTDEQLKMLDSLNASIDSIRGEATPVEVGGAVQVISPVTDIPANSGDVSADPK